MKNIKVLMPKWWTEGKKVFGYTDGVDTCACELMVSWFVRVPEYGYDGYFHKKDLEVMR